MYMPLIAQEAGMVNLIKQPGATLEAGDILGVLALDDPSKVKSAQNYVGLLPRSWCSSDHGRKTTTTFCCPIQHPPKHPPRFR